MNSKEYVTRLGEAIVDDLVKLESHDFAHNKYMVINRAPMKLVGQGTEISVREPVVRFHTTRGKLIRTKCYEVLGQYLSQILGTKMVILHLDLPSCSSSILAGLYPNPLPTIEALIERHGLWSSMRAEMEANGQGHLYNEGIVKQCAYASLFLGGKDFLEFVILCYLRHEVNLTETDVQPNIDLKCKDTASKLASEIVNLSVVREIEELSFHIKGTHLNKYLANKYLEGPTGHRCRVTDETFVYDYFNYLNSYEVALRAQATLTTLGAFPQAELLGHYDDGNLFLLPMYQKQAFLHSISEQVEDIGDRLGLQFPQHLKFKRCYGEA